MSTFPVEALLHWVAVGAYALAVALFANALIFGHSRRARWGLLAAALGLVPHGAALVIRWIATGHGPYMLKYEVLSSNAWIAVAFLVAFVALRPAWSAFALVVLPVATLMVAAGVFSSPEVRELPPTLRSTWLVFHVSFAKLAGAAYLLSLGSAVLILLEARRTPAAWLRRLPGSDALDAYVVRFIGFGFLFWTITIGAGAIWANQSWGRYWAWDPIETWSLVTWLSYGSVLHLRLFFHTSARTTAWLAVGAFVVFVTAVIFLPFVMPSMHSAYMQ